MRLFVTDNPNTEISIDVVVMNSAEFNSISNHPYIVDSEFDSIVIDTNLDINLEYLKAALGTNVIIPRIVGEITSKTINLLMTIYPDKSALLQYNFMLGVDKVKPIIEDMCKSFEWESFY